MRRQAILDAATELFLERGFERTSLTDILSRSKGSRTTLYQQFGGKEGLLCAMIEEVTAEVWARIDVDDTGGPPDEESLVRLGGAFVRSAMSPRAIAVFRILAAEGRRIPRIAALFDERGPRAVERHLTRLFQGAAASDGSGTPTQLGQVFLGAVLGVIHSREALGLPSGHDAAAVEAHVRIAVRVFLHGLVSRPPSAGGGEDSRRLRQES